MKKKIVNFAIHLALFILERAFAFLHNYYHIYYDTDSECFELEDKHNEKP